MKNGKKEREGRERENPQERLLRHLFPPAPLSGCGVFELCRRARVDSERQRLCTPARKRSPSHRAVRASTMKIEEVNVRRSSSVTATLPPLPGCGVLPTTAIFAPNSERQRLPLATEHTLLPERCVVHQRCEVKKIHRAHVMLAGAPGYRHDGVWSSNFRSEFGAPATATRHRHHSFLRRESFMQRRCGCELPAGDRAPAPPDYRDAETPNFRSEESERPHGGCPPQTHLLPERCVVHAGTKQLNVHRRT